MKKFNAIKRSLLSSVIVIPLAMSVTQTGNTATATPPNPLIPEPGCVYTLCMGSDFPDLTEGCAEIMQTVKLEMEQGGVPPTCSSLEAFDTGGTTEPVRDPNSAVMAQQSCNQNLYSAMTDAERAELSDNCVSDESYFTKYVPGNDYKNVTESDDYIRDAQSKNYEQNVNDTRYIDELAKRGLTVEQPTRSAKDIEEVNRMMEERGITLSTIK